VRAADVGDAPEYRGRRTGGVDRQILQRRQRVDLVLRRLQRDRKVTPFFSLSQ